MRVHLTVIAAICIIYVFFLVPLFQKTFAAHFPSHYAYEFNYTNLYSTYPLRYDISDLDSSTTYLFRIQFLSRTTGAVTQEMEPVIIGPGVTSGSFVVTDWPTNIAAPFRVIDQYDQVLGYHFLAPIPANAWFANADHADFGHKTAMKLVPYGAADAGGFQHPATAPSLTITVDNDVTLLHYQLEEATDNIDTAIVFRSMLDGSALATISLDEALAYNWPVCDVACTSTAPEDAFQDANFLVMTTSGNRPFYINGDREDAAFNGVFAVPHLLTVDHGVYDFARYTAMSSTPTFDAIGESPWIVSSAGSANGEWDFSLLVDTVAQGEKQRAFIRSATEEVWEAYIDQVLTDTSVASADLSNGLLRNEYVDDRSIGYNVGTDIDLQTVQWTLLPTAPNWVTVTSDYAFALGANYVLTETPTVTDRVLSYLDRFGLANTFGVLSVSVLGLLIVFAAFKGNRTPVFLYVIVFDAVIFTLVISSLLPQSIDVLLSIIAIIALPIGLRAGRKETE